MSTAQRHDHCPAQTPHEKFDESVGLDDPKPFPDWQPSPDQIRRWCEQIREGWTGAERLRALRCDERPQVMAADMRLVDVSEADYSAHQRRGCGQ